MTTHRSERSMTLDEAIKAANDTNPDVVVKAVEPWPQLDADGSVIVMAETRVNGQLYAAWRTIDPPENVVAAAIEHARAEAADHEAYAKAQAAG